MSRIGQLVLRRRKTLPGSRGDTMTRAELAEMASQVDGAPDISEDWIRWLERTHAGPRPPRPDMLRPVCCVLGLDWSLISRELGFA